MKNYHNVAFVIPCHRNDFLYLRYFLNTFLVNFNLGDTCDAIVVMSEESEIKDFLLMYPSLDIDNFKFESIDNYVKRQLSKEQGVINIKKFYGIHKNPEYDYYIPVDSESVIISLKNIYKKCQTEDLSKTIYGSKISRDFLAKINQNSLDFLLSFCSSKEEELKMKKCIDKSLYTFWSNMPVYENKKIKNLLDFIKFDNEGEILENINWFCFDHVLYQYYCLAFFDFKLLDYEKTTNGLNKKIDMTHFKRLESTGYIVNWTVPEHYTENKDYFRERLVMLHSIDKNKRWERQKNIDFFKELNTGIVLDYKE